MNYFISDLHFGHKNCLSFDNRNFDTIEDMDNTIFKNWNDVISMENVKLLKVLVIRQFQNKL